MFTVNFKARPNPRDQKMAKIDMVLFLTHYPRVTKVVNITGPIKDWDLKNQCFKTRISDYADKNRILFDLKTSYIEVAESWEKEGKTWSPVQWAHCFDKVKEEKEQSKVLSCLQALEIVRDDIRKRERFKNGMSFTSASTADKYLTLQNSLSAFTKEVYGKSFSGYFFQDITETFVHDFVLFLQKRGAEQGHNGNVYNHLKMLYGVLYYSSKKKIPGIDLTVMDAEWQKLKRTTKAFVPKTLPNSVIVQIENIDRSLFSRLEQFYIDLFLFSYYTGGMANIDVAYLTWRSIENDIITYERIKFPKEAQVPFTDKAKAIVEKYRNKCHGDFVLPVFSHKHKTETQQRGRLKRLYEGANETLRKVRDLIRYDGEITWYAARGTFITTMMRNGYHPADVAKYAGNSPATIYNNYYKNTNYTNVLRDMNMIQSGHDLTSGTIK